MLNKSGILTGIFALLLMQSFAQAPQLISYQGVARDNSGTILASQNISLSLSLHQATPNGTVRWHATYDITTNPFGLFSVEIGGGNLVSGSMNIDWASGPYYIETAMDASGGSNYVSLGTQQLVAVPYALYAASSADNQWEKVDNTIHNTNSGSVGINEVLPYATLHVSRAVSDAETPLSLLENTGILIVGPIEDNIVADYRGIQARHGDYISSDLTLTPAELNLQRLGGNILIHGDNSGDLGKVIVTGGGKVGIGISQPVSMLHVKETNTEAFASIAAYISNQASTTSTSADDHRVGLKIVNNGSWGGNAASKDIGLYIANVAGQSSANSNIAAVLNGNTVIGDITGNMIGANGYRVLSIQNGAAPASTTTNALQIYSADIERPGLPAISSAIHVMTGDGAIIKLYKEQALPAPDASAVSSTTYGSTEAAIINNMRDRIDALELRLQALGLLN